MKNAFNPKRALAAMLVLVLAAKGHASPPTDSTFAPNTRGGWKNYNTYMAATPNGVELELVPYKEKAQGGNWSFPFLIGKITDARYLPTAEVTVTNKEPNRKWTMTIKMDGDCLLQLAAGTPPAAGTVIPIKARYKK